MSESSRPLFRILSLAGGGYLGLYTAAVLAALEERLGEPLGRRFDLVAGTSVGGILALGLGFEIPMQKMVELFQQHGSEVFSRRGLPSSGIGQLIDLTRSVLGPKYSGRALREALAAFFDDRRLGESRHPLVIPAVNVSRCQTKVFKTPHGSDSRGDETLSAVDVAMATSAAPAYFPLVPIKGELYCDGGLFAVAPDQVAMHEAQHFLGVKPRDIAVLSVGTATAGYQPPEGVKDDAGAVDWLSGGRLILTLVSVQQQHVQAMMEDRLGSRYLRLDAAWPSDQGLGIDVATPEATEVLLARARETLEKDLPRAIEWLSRGPGLG